MKKKAIALLTAAAMTISVLAGWDNTGHGSGSGRNGIGRCGEFCISGSRR